MDQKKLYLMLAGRAVVDEGYRNALLADPDAVLKGSGLDATNKKRLLEALRTKNLEDAKVAKLPDIFGTRGSQPEF